MALFKKKEVLEVPQFGGVSEQVTRPVMEAGLRPKVAGSVFELGAEELNRVYMGSFPVGDLSHVETLLFAVFCELRALRKLVEEQ